MTPEDALEFLVSEHRYPAGDREAYSALENVLRSDWAVRVLDAWRGEKRSARWWSMREAHDYDGKLSDFCCCLEWVGGSKDYAGASGDAVRLAAADAIWPSLLESVRAEIGPKP